MAWYKHFDVQKHAVHKDDPKSKVLILTQHKDDDEKRMKQLKSKKRAQFKFKVIDVTKLNNKTLLNKIFYDEEFGGSTNLILNFYDSDSECRQKLMGLYFNICPMPGLGCKLKMDGGNFKFIEVTESWLSSLNGAYLMASVETSGDSWKEKVKHLCTTHIIRKKKEFRILVLSGTHGSKDSLESGFTHKHLLDNDMYTFDLGSANRLEKEMKESEFELKIEVARMRDFCKALEPKKDLCEFVQGKNPNMVVMAWCYSNNGDVCMALRRNADLSRMLVEAEMRKIGIKDAKIDEDQIEVLKKAQNPKIKDIILTGGTGSGKTIIGAEVVKIWIAQHETLASEQTQEQGKPDVYIITHGKEEGVLKSLLKLDPLLANLEKKTFEDLPIKNLLDIGELTKFAPKQNSDNKYESKSTKEVIEGWIEKEKIGTKKKAIVMIDEVPAQSIFQQHSSTKEKWKEMKKKNFKDSGSVPLSFDLCFLSKYKNIQFVIIMTPSTRNYENDFPKLFEFPQSEYGERKISEVDGSYYYSELAPEKPNKDIQQSKVDQCLQFYHHLPARYRNCVEIMKFMKFVSNNEEILGKRLNDNKDKSVDPRKLPPSYPLPAGLKPVIWIQALKEPDFKDFKALMDFLEKSSQSELHLSKESVTVLGTTNIKYQELLKCVLDLKNENEVKKSEVYQYLHEQNSFLKRS